MKKFKNIVKHNNDITDKLIKLLSFFINRPNHLAKYLIDNSALTPEFLKKINSVELPDNAEQKIKEIYFKDFNQMKQFFNNLLNSNVYPNKFDEKSLIDELEKELKVCILEERYEDAIRIRDYLKKNNKKKDTD